MVTYHRSPTAAEQEGASNMSTTDIDCPTCGHEWYARKNGRTINAGAKHWTDGDVEMIQCAGCGRNHNANEVLA